MLAFGTQVRGFKPVGFLRVNKNPQHVWGHGCLSVVIVVCCQVELPAGSTTQNKAVITNNSTMIGLFTTDTSNKNLQPK